MSFVQVRGSVPVYWSQPGYKYRPPPRLDRGKFELKTQHLQKNIMVLFFSFMIKCPTIFSGALIIARRRWQRIHNLDVPSLYFVTT